MSTPSKKPEPPANPEPPKPESVPDPSERLFEALWYGTVDGEAFDGDPADLDFF